MNPFSVLVLPPGPQVMWTDHCLQDSVGADLHSDMVMEPTDLVVPAGFNPVSDSYSAFRDNDAKSTNPLLDIIKGERITHLFVCGLATDYCVQYTALDAKMLTDAKIYLIQDASAALSDAGEVEALDNCRREGIQIIQSTDSIISALPKFTPVPKAVRERSPQETKDLALRQACFDLDVDAARAALAAGADKWARLLPLGKNMLHCSVGSITLRGTARDDAACVALIRLALSDTRSGYIDAVTDSSSQFGGGFSALMIASWVGNETAVRELLKNGARTETADNMEGVTALMLACRAKHANIVELLVDAGANIWAQSRFKKTAIMYAAAAVKSARVEAVKRHEASSLQALAVHADSDSSASDDILERESGDLLATGGAGGAEESKVSMGGHFGTQLAPLGGGNAAKAGTGSGSFHLAPSDKVVPSSESSPLVPRVGSLMPPTAGPSMISMTGMGPQSFSFQPQAIPQKNKKRAPRQSPRRRSSSVRFKWRSLGYQQHIAEESTAPEKVAADVLSALLVRCDRTDLEQLLRETDVGGWSAIHFAAKTGTLFYIRWRHLLDDQQLPTKLFEAKTGIDDHQPIHLAVWNKQYSSVLLLAPPLELTPSELFRPYDGIVQLSDTSGRTPRAPLDLALEAHDTAAVRMLLRSAAHAQAQDTGDLSDEALERAVLELDLRATQTLLQFSENAVSLEEHAISILKQVKQPHVCTFAFAGYNNPSKQHMYRCVTCSVDICLMCSTHCHDHKEIDDAPPLERKGFVNDMVYCHCPRRTCKCAGTEGATAEDIKSFRPDPRDLSSLRLTFRANQLVCHIDGDRKALEGSGDEGVSDDDGKAASGPGSALSDGIGSIDKLLGGTGSRRRVAPLEHPVERSKLVYTVAKALHASDMMFKLFRGWRSGDEYDTVAKTSPDLRAFASVSSECRSKWISKAVWFLKVVLTSGYTITLPASDGNGAPGSPVGAASSASPMTVHVDERGVPVSSEHGRSDAHQKGATSKREELSPATMHEMVLAIMASEQEHLEECKDLLARGFVFGEASADGAHATTSPILQPFDLLDGQQKSLPVYIYALVLRLLREAKVRVALSDKHRYRSYLLRLAKRKRAAGVRKMVEEGRLRDMRQHSWGAFLLRAARRGDADLVYKVMEVRDAKPAPDIDYRRPGTRQTPLHIAAQRGHLDVVKRLLSFDARMELKDVQGLTPLSSAAFCGQTRVCILLINAGASALTCDAFGLTPVHHAAVTGHLQTARLFAKHMSKLKAAGDLDGAEADPSLALLSQDKATEAPIVQQSESRNDAKKRWRKAKATVLTTGIAKAGVRRRSALLSDADGSVAKQQIGGANSVAPWVAVTYREYRHRKLRTMRKLVRKLRPEEKMDLAIPDTMFDFTAKPVEELLPSSLPMERIRAVVCCRKPRPPSFDITADHLGAGGTSLYSPLALAVKANHADMVELFLKHGIDPTHRDGTGISPYDRALRAHGSLSLVRENLTEFAKQVGDIAARELAAAQQDIRKRSRSQSFGDGELGARDRGHGGHGINRRVSAASAVSARSTVGVTAQAQSVAKATMERVKRRIASYERREQATAKVIEKLHAAPKVQALRGSAAVQQVCLRLLAFLLTTAALFAVAPVGGDWDPTEMNALSALTKQGYFGTLSDVASIPSWWAWVDDVFLNEADGIVTERPDGTLQTFGQTVVGPMKLTIQRLLPAGSQYGDVAHTYQCLVDEELADVLGWCGGGATTNTSFADSSLELGALELQERSTTLYGNVTQLKSGLDAVEKDYGDIREIRIQLSQYDPPTGLWLGTKLSARVMGTGLVDGSVYTQVNTTTVLLFHDTLPPSVTFEIVIMIIQVLQVLATVYRLKVARWSFLRYIRSGGNIFDLILIALLLLAQLSERDMHQKANVLRQQLFDAVGDSPASRGANIFDAAHATMYSGEFVDIEDLASNVQDMGDLFAVALLMVGARVVSHLTLVPKLGPMLVAVTATLRDMSVVLYLALFGLLMSFFGIAFHMAVGRETQTFGTLGSSIVGLFNIALGENSFIRSDTPPRTFTTVLFVVFIMFLGIVILNLFIGIVTDVYPAAKSRSEHDWEQLVTQMLEDRFDLVGRLAQRLQARRAHLARRLIKKSGAGGDSSGDEWKGFGKLVATRQERTTSAGSARALSPSSSTGGRTAVTYFGGRLPPQPTRKSSVVPDVIVWDGDTSASEAAVISDSDGGDSTSGVDNGGGRRRRSLARYGTSASAADTAISQG